MKNKAWFKKVKRVLLIPFRPIARICKGGVASLKNWTFSCCAALDKRNLCNPLPRRGGGLGVLPPKFLKTEMLLDALWCIILSKMQ